MLLVFTFAAFAAAQPAAPVDAIKAAIDKHYADIEGLYKHLHTHPELSFQEEQTGVRLAKEMRDIGFQVTDRVGGFGLVCLYKNGDGPNVMVRTDMDALPVTEQTGVAYASQVKVRDAEGRDVGIMHACGHDVHMAVWVGTARTLVDLKDRWKGTLMFIAQPAEERGAGARAMLADGLFEKFKKPDYALALHVTPFLAHGTVGYTAGPAMANVDSVDILVKGRGGHGAAPHKSIDPIVIAARIVLDLQTIVSRELDPLESAVVTVGSIHGGSKHNIIPSEVKLQLTVRSFNDETRMHVLKAIERITKAAAAAADAPEPYVKVDYDEFTPALSNNRELTAFVVKSLTPVLGKENLLPQPPVMGGEDFARYGLAGVPICMFRLGTLPPARIERMKEGKESIPSLHSALYYPIPEPSLRTGMLSMTTAVLSVMNK